MRCSKATAISTPLTVSLRYFASLTSRYLRRRIFCGKGPKPPMPGGMRVMKKLRVPKESMRDCMYPLSPSMIAATMITLVTPITIPRMVSAERALRARSVSRATWMFSRISIELFRSQGDHRIELRRFHRGIEAEEQSDRPTQKHAEDRDPGLHRRGEGRQLPQRDGAEESAGHPDRSADDALHDAFDYELLQHVAASRTDGAPDADLFGALGDADQHDVHDHDSAHHRRDGADHQEDHEKGGADLLPQRDVAFRSADEEIVVLSGKDMAPAAQDAAGIVLREDEVGIGAVGFYADGEAVALPAVLQEGAQRDHDEIVLIAAEHAADFLEGADDGVFGAAGADGLAERAGIGKEFVQHPIADQADFGGVKVLDFREVAAGGDGAGVDIGHGGRVAVNGDVVELVIQIVKRRAGVERSADVAAMRAVAGDGLHIGGGEEPVALGAVQNGEIDDGEWEAAHLKHIRSQIRDFLLDVEVGALNDGHHGDQSRHAHSDAEHRESSSQLMGADGVQRKRNVIPDPDHWWMSRFYRKTASGRDARAYQLVETQDEAVVDVGDRGGRGLGAGARRGGDYGAGGPQSDAIAGGAPPVHLSAKAAP